MAGCPDNCDCTMEASQGLIVEGTGTLGDPYIVHPDLGRALELSVDFASELPVLPDMNGELAWVDQEELLYVWTVDAGWRPLGNDYRQTFPNAEPVDDPAGTWVAASSYVTLTPGYWFVSANGVLSGTLDPPASSGVSSVDYSAVEVQVRIADSGGSGEVYDVTAMNASSLRVTFDGGVEALFAPDIKVPYHLQDVLNVPAGQTRLVTQHVRRLQDGPTMALEVKSLDVAALRVAQFNYTV